MNGTVKDATVKRYHRDGHDQRRSHSAGFLDACSVAGRLTTLNGVTLHGCI